MRTDLLVKFQELYEVFRNTEDYVNRVKQFAIVRVNKEIIQETLKHDPLLNEHLTGLIQMFKHGCKDGTFDKYLEQNIADKIRRDEISEEAYEINEWGYTGAGLNAVTNLTAKQLVMVKTFLLDAFAIKTIEEAIALCTRFDSNLIPLVKSGIYSPWLYYINPELFPILNNSHIQFREWIDMQPDYPSCIRDFNELKVLVNERELGVLDMFAHNFVNYKKLPTDFKLLNLNGKRFYKVSHGVFKKSPDYKHTGIAELLEKNKWACLHSETGKGAGYEFEYNASIGDYIYLCYGGDDLYCIGKINSDAKYLDKATNDLFGGDDKWIYREIEPLFYPKIASVREFKSDTRFFMPSGNSTFYEVPKGQLDYLNEKIFIPKVNLKVIDTTIKKLIPVETTTNEQINKASMNSILYGPPGTGKTFHSINHAVAIVENKSVEQVADEDRELVKNRFDQYVIDGQIVFCTFHQSLNYEDFIEGIKPIEPDSEDEQLSYAVEDGIFKKLCTEAAFSFVKQQTDADTEKALDFSTAYDMFVDTVNEKLSNREKIEIPTRSGGNITVESISQKGNIHVRHIEGKRTYGVSKKRLSKISQAFPDLGNVTNINDQFRAEIGGSNSSTYWAVLNAIRTQTADGDAKTTLEKVEKDYSYEDKKEIIGSFKAENYKVENPKKFVLIIDEINRGNVSQIFGELITLIEEDKRLGKDEALKATLPYSKENFGVPLNLYIVGTMNTADRSVEALDTALRRRFSFVPKMPEEYKLTITEDGIDLPQILKTINTRLRILKDSDHTIGHAWLWSVSNTRQLQLVFENKILPLLQEYFYNDYEKLGLVLGDVFFKSSKQIDSNIFASFSGGNGLAGQYDQSWQYQLKAANELTTADFKTLEIQHTQWPTDEVE
jgi:hypothetical protein